MKSVMKALKALGALAACIIALGAGHALAAQLDAAGPSLGAAQPTVSACTSDPLRVSYAVGYSPSVGSSGGYAVSDVTVTDTAASPDLAACVGQTYRVTVLGASGFSLGEVSGVVPAGEASFSPTPGFSAPVDASAITGVILAIDG